MRFSLNLIARRCFGSPLLFEQACRLRTMADRSVFIVEKPNICQETLERSTNPFVFYTATVSRTDLTGLSCRVLDLL